jgi:hypothetical protein
MLLYNKIYLHKIGLVMGVFISYKMTYFQMNINNYNKYK